MIAPALPLPPPAPSRPRRRAPMCDRMPHVRLTGSAVVVRAFRANVPLLCGCRHCERPGTVIRPGEWFTFGNQRDNRGKYARCTSCMPFEEVTP